jgi:hypothetical protein
MHSSIADDNLQYFEKEFLTHENKRMLENVLVRIWIFNL